MQYIIELQFNPSGAPRYERLENVEADTIEALANAVNEILESFVDSEGNDFFQIQYGDWSILDNTGEWLCGVENRVRKLITPVYVR